MNVPLSYALYQTPVTCITQYLTRQYKNAGWMFVFKQDNDDDFGDQLDCE
jgi:hypothetical protein